MQAQLTVYPAAGGEQHAAICFTNDGHGSQYARVAVTPGEAVDFLSDATGSGPGFRLTSYWNARGILHVRIEMAPSGLSADRLIAEADAQQAASAIIGSGLMASVDEAIATMVKNIEVATGQRISEWIRRARASGFGKHGEILKWLKEQHGIGHGYANYIAKAALASDDQDEESLVAAQYAGKKSALMPLYEELVKVLKSLGKDVEIAAKKNNVSIRRSKQFALLQPSTADRLDVGLILKGVKPSTRLEASGSFNAMFTHRVRVSSKGDIDAELKAWLKRAYKEA